MYHFDPYNVFLAIATNIPERLKTGLVLQGHMCLTLCTVAPRLASTQSESISTLRLYVCPVTMYDLQMKEKRINHVHEVTCDVRF